MFSPFWHEDPFHPAAQPSVQDPVKRLHKFFCLQ